MAFNAQPGEQYTIRRQVFRIFGAGFHVYNPAGEVVAYCKQAAFRLKEDLRLYADDSCATEILCIKARNIIDFSATYDVSLPGGQALGSLQRQGMKSTFVRDEWKVFNAEGRQTATLLEDSGTLALLRRWVEWVAIFAPEKFTLTSTDGRAIATYRQHFNPFVYRLGVAVQADDDELDDLMLLATGVLIAAIEGRQSSS